jgi:hypothetical protein
MNVTIERRHKCLTVGGKEGWYNCGVGVIHEDIPYGRACPLSRGAHGGGQYPWPKVGEECWNSRLDDRLEAVAASIHLEVMAATI